MLTWLAIAGIGGPTFGRLEEVSSNDQASFLPAGAEATAAQDWQAKFRDSNEIPAVIVIESDSAFTPAQLGEAAALKDKLEALEPGSTVIGPIPSEDGKAVQFVVPIDSLRRGQGRRQGAPRRWSQAIRSGGNADLRDRSGRAHRRPGQRLRRH